MITTTLDNVFSFAFIVFLAQCLFLGLALGSLGKARYGFIDSVRGVLRASIPSPKTYFGVLVALILLAGIVMPDLAGNFVLALITGLVIKFVVQPKLVRRHVEEAGAAAATRNHLDATVYGAQSYGTTPPPNV